MQLYSTKQQQQFVDLKEAVLRGLPPDNGLYMPEFIPRLSTNFITNLSNYSFPELSFEVAQALIGDSIPSFELKTIVHEAINFPAPVVKLSDQFGILELFHGPSLAFKDFGARFMARLMSYFNRDNDQELVILVATSGDTGGAVAAGFYDTPGIQVVILYPSGKVSPLQEKQLTTLGKNITALEVQGTFDDCQALVKQAFLDQDLIKNIRLSSANSINIARLIPQSFYYFEAYKQLETKLPVVFTVPSGNFGNLTAGLIAQKMGLPIHHFVAATNANDVVPVYLNTGDYLPKPSVRTISNAMDVGNPSNFARMQDLYGSTWNIIKDEISGFSYNDTQTKEGLKEVYDRFNYIIDPHGAVGFLAAKAYLEHNPNTFHVILETAHPSKFIQDVENILKIKVDIPQRLAELADKKKEATLVDTSFSTFKDWLISNY